jgi:hypothetical protein
LQGWWAGCLANHPTGWVQRDVWNEMADLAGGGLKLQTLGVAFLLVGTLMTAIW